MGQIFGTWELLLNEYMLIVEKNIDLQILTGRLQLRLLAGIKIVQMPLMERCTRYTITLLLTKSCREQWCISLNTSHKLLDKKLYFCSRNLILIRFVLYIHLYPNSTFQTLDCYNKQYLPVTCNCENWVFPDDADAASPIIWKCHMYTWN